MTMIFVTGGAGFIGANFVLNWLARGKEPVTTLDKLTYAGRIENLATVKDHPNHTFVQADINDAATLGALLHRDRPRAIIHFAAETHVDRSIQSPAVFAETNVQGTFRLLEAARGYWITLSDADREAFRFIHISTDEVFGSLTATAPSFTEQSPYAPNSPYSASKAAADHFARAYFQTYGFPTMIVRGSNTYGPRQYPEKLIPRTIARALQEQHVPIYGNGSNIRDWLYVDDFCAAVTAALAHGKPGESYNIGGMSERANIDIVTWILTRLDKLSPRKSGQSYTALLTFVANRAGHDFRYSVATYKSQYQLGWTPQTALPAGLAATIEWFLNHPEGLETDDEDEEWT
ncbi:MAG: dTDP-glucose 4,6-dehydratase [Burkholderiales bacterium]|nr:dTDP-glucose 4,6-dehydratase [Burkholderiales bacterium]